MSSDEGACQKATTEHLEKKMMQIFVRWTRTTMPGNGGVTQHDAEHFADTSAQLEVFSGDGGSLSAAEWIDRLEVAKDIGVWSEAKTRSVLLCKLTGRARLWHLRSGTKLEMFDKWKKTFVDEFSPQLQTRKLVLSLNNRIQTGGEPVQLYVWRSIVASARLGLSPADAKDQILSHIQPEHKFLVQELRDRAHDDITDLLKDVEKSIEFRRSLSVLRRGTEYRISLWWQRAARGNRPLHAVEGGLESGETMYVARAFHAGELIPGKLVPKRKVVSVPYSKKEEFFPDYEVLAAECPLEWVLCDHNTYWLPPGAIQGGYTKTGEPLYIGRTQHRESITCGKVMWSRQMCYVSWGGEEWSYKVFDILTCASVKLG